MRLPIQPYGLLQNQGLGSRINKQGDESATENTP
jgi:hypothetical protein